MFCSTLKARLAGEDIFSLVHCHRTLHHRADIRDIRTDGAKSVLGKERGLIALVKSLVTDIGSSHCIIHMHTLGVFGGWGERRVESEPSECPQRSCVVYTLLLLYGISNFGKL